MYQGDQFYVQCTVKNSGGVKFTPNNCVDIKIQIGLLEKKYSDGSLTWDNENECWLFPLMQEDTLKMCNTVSQQAQVMIDENTIISTPVIKKSIGESIIKKKWGD